MIYREYEFVDCAFGDVRNRNHVIDHRKIVLPDPPVGCFATYCRYPESYRVHYLKNNHHVADYHGSCYADFVPIDIDNSNLHASLKTGRDFLKYLEAEFYLPLDSLDVSFSGLKGFHILLPITLLGDVKPTADLPARFKTLVKSLGNWGFDMTVYQPNRLLRLPNTIHAKTGLYKIRISTREFLHLPLKDILERAKQPVDLDQFSDDAADPVPALQELWEQGKNAPRTWRSLQPKARAGPLTFLAQGVSQGVRNHTAFAHASRLKSLGKSLEEAEEQILQWNRLNRPPIRDLAEIRRTVASAFSYEGVLIDPTNLLQGLRYEPVYQAMDANSRDVYLTILIRANIETKQSYDGIWNYRYEPGDQKFTFRSYKQHCAPGTSEYQVRKAVDELIKIGYIELLNLGGTRGSILRLLKPLTQYFTKVDTIDDCS